MELFEKYYNCYYQVIRHILMEAESSPVTEKRMRELSELYGYQESALAIVPKLLDGTWPFLSSSGCTVLTHPDVLKPGALPLTKVQKSWLSALLKDPRIRLFLTEEQYGEAAFWLSGTDPLFSWKDFHFFDTYEDRDPYEDTEYKTRFHIILNALQNRQALFIAYENRKGESSVREAAPYQLQYSSRDGKFRLCCLERSGKQFSKNTILNLGRILACHPSHEKVPETAALRSFLPVRRCEEPVVLEIGGERNSLERCMLHFANYEKRTRYNEETKTWICSLYYDMADETELLIEILSFGPVIRVLGPDSFLEQIRARVTRQHELFYKPI